jgi:hypothetical protein
MSVIWSTELNYRRDFINRGWQNNQPRVDALSALIKNHQEQEAERNGLSPSAEQPASAAVTVKKAPPKKMQSAYRPQRNGPLSSRDIVQTIYS